MKKLVVLLFAGLVWAGEPVNLEVINRIKAEAFQNSKVMDHALYLTDVIGPRLSATPAYRRAADWAVKRMQEWGLHARLEKWGPYGRGWANLRFHAGMKEPYYQPLIAVARPYSPGTGGPVSGVADLAVVRTEADLEKVKLKLAGKLKGRIVLLEEPRRMQPQTEAMSRRYTDQELAQQALAPDPGQQRPASPNREAMTRFRNKLNQFLKDEGVLVTVVPSARTDGGTVFAGPAGSRDPKDTQPPPSVALTAEHYNQIARLIEKKVPVTLEFDIENRFYDEPETVNVLADLPGTTKKDEIVMVGAHLDSWTFGNGATDDASGCAVMMEAMRILKALNLRMPRTVRIGLWAAEEQGLLGSAAYVRQHMAERDSMTLKPEHARFSGYFNYDNGTGKIRGVYLQGNDMMRPIFEAWLAPFRDLGASTVTIRNTSGTDHLSFDAVGLPGFQFIQDPVEYMTRTHHSNMDVYDRLQESDLMQSAAIVASLVYHAATREQLLPRKPLPKPKAGR